MTDFPKNNYKKIKQIEKYLLKVTDTVLETSKTDNIFH